MILESTGGGDDDDDEKMEPRHSWNNYIMNDYAVFQPNKLFNCNSFNTNLCTPHTSPSAQDLDEAVEDDKGADDLRGADVHADGGEDAEDAAADGARTWGHALRQAGLGLDGKLLEELHVALARVHELHRREIVRHVGEIAGDNAGKHAAARGAEGGPAGGVFLLVVHCLGGGCFVDDVLDALL
jgi:hypothetical protein